MFGRTKAKLSSIFNRKAITTHQFQQEIILPVMAEFSGRHIYSISGLSRTWAEAVPVSKDRYAVTQKWLQTHNTWGVSGSSRLDKAGISATFGNERKSIFTLAEATAVLKLAEKYFEKEGYGPSQRQPFKKRIYANK